MINRVIVVALPDVRYRQRVQKRLTRLRKRLLAFVIKANPECFDHGGRLAPGCFPARIPPEATDLHGLMRRAECKLAMIRCHAECAIALAHVGGYKSHVNPGCRPKSKHSFRILPVPLPLDAAAPCQSPASTRCAGPWPIPPPLRIDLHDPPCRSHQLL